MPDDTKVRKGSPGWKMGTSKRGEDLASQAAKVPGPGAYEPKVKVKLILRPRTKKKQGSSPAVGIHGRTTTEKPTNNFVPGPGQYQTNVKHVLPAISYGYTFSGRPKSIEIEKQKTAPGPGNYQVENAGKPKHGPVFGSAPRSGMEIKETKKVPGPGAYNATEAAAKILAGPKFGFGKASRDKDLVKATAAVPGPGAYQVTEKVGKEGKKFTLAGRPKSAGKTSLTVPGPAAYNPRLTDAKKGFSFGTAAGKKEGKEKILVPGPGQYNTVDKYQAVKRSSPSWKYPFDLRGAAFWIMLEQKI